MSTWANASLGFVLIACAANAQPLETRDAAADVIREAAYQEANPPPVKPDAGELPPICYSLDCMAQNAKDLSCVVLCKAPVNGPTPSYLRTCETCATPERIRDCGYLCVSQ
jgi:hypothetical protein